jgi:hypothetical protein
MVLVTSSGQWVTTIGLDRLEPRGDGFQRLVVRAEPLVGKVEERRNGADRAAAGDRFAPPDEVLGFAADVPVAAEAGAVGRDGLVAVAGEHRHEAADAPHRVVGMAAEDGDAKLRGRFGRRERERRRPAAAGRGRRTARALSASDEGVELLGRERAAAQTAPFSSTWARSFIPHSGAVTPGVDRTNWRHRWASVLSPGTSP